MCVLWHWWQHNDLRPVLVEQFYREPQLDRFMLQTPHLGPFISLISERRTGCILWCWETVTSTQSILKKFPTKVQNISYFAPSFPRPTWPDPNTSLNLVLDSRNRDLFPWHFRVHGKTSDFILLLLPSEGESGWNTPPVFPTQGFVFASTELLAMLTSVKWS